MEFAHPEYLYCFFVIPIIFFLYLIFASARRKALARLADAHLLQNLTPEASSSKILAKSLLFLLALSFLIFAIAGPRYGVQKQEVKRSGSDIILALDVSKSMLAQDIQPNRLERAKGAISRLIDRLGQNRIGLIVFAGEAFTQLPITTDYVSAKMFLSTITPEIVPVQGTAIAEAINLAAKSFSPTSTAAKSIIIITDGENHEADPIPAVKKAVEAGINIYCVGIGDTRGVPIPDPDTQNSFLKDRSGQTVLTRLDEQILQTIAETGNGIYAHASGGDLGLNSIYSEIENLQKEDYSETTYATYAEMYQWPLAMALLLFVLEILISYRRNRFSIFAKKQWNNSLSFC